MMNDISWFRALLHESSSLEHHDPTPIIDWLERQRGTVQFHAELIGLKEARGWHQDEVTGNVVHESGAFFSIECARTTSSNQREVNSWDQPIYNQKEGGILALLCKHQNRKISFLLNAKAEPGNIGILQLAPTLQATWSNLNKAHKGKSPPFADVLLGKTSARVVYKALHNEEGGRFWRKSNSNEIYLLNPAQNIEFDENKFIWASLSQIKALALLDNLLNPFVKTIISPL